ncbi:hypothetical protein ACL1EU_12125 [Corynebacterium striatum]
MSREVRARITAVSRERQAFIQERHRHQDNDLHPPAAAATAYDISATKDFIRAWQRWQRQAEATYTSRN